MGCGYVIGKGFVCEGLVAQCVVAAGEGTMLLVRVKAVHCVVHCVWEGWW